MFERLLERIAVEFNSRSIPYLIIGGRPRDIEDVRSVLLKNPQVDVTYIRRWLGELGAALNEPLVERFEDVLKSAQ